MGGNIGNNHDAIQHDPFPQLRNRDGNGENPNDPNSQVISRIDSQYGPTGSTRSAMQIASPDCHMGEGTPVQGGPHHGMILERYQAIRWTREGDDQYPSPQRRQLAAQLK